MKTNRNNIIIGCLYVDDLMLTHNNSQEIENFKKRLKSESGMTNLRQLSYFLGIEFNKTNRGYFMHQKKYVINISKGSRWKIVI